MKKIVLAQPGYRTGPLHKNAWYLPYTTGCLWAYASHDPFISKNIAIEDWIWNRPHIKQTLEKWSHVDVLFCSVYIWNENYCTEMSMAVKDKFPHAKIIWGGPQCDHSNPNVFKNKPFIDLICANEGEITFKEICEALIKDKPIDDIKNCVVNKNQQAITNTFRNRADINNFPSPYTSGVFDDIMKNTTGVNWSVIFETNRGCPYSCTYCDWGSLTASKIKKFDLEKVRRELEWFAEKNISWIMTADANFGILKDRDVEIAKMMVETQQKNKKLEGLTIQFLKNKTENIIEIGKIVKHLSTNGISIPVQTLDLNTLENIKRGNMEINDIQTLMKKLDIENISYYTELILGMPGESLQSWKQNFWKLYEAGFHKAFNVYPLLSSVNTELAKVQVEKHKMKTSQMSVVPQDMYINEYADVIVETDTMPFDDYISAWVFTKMQIFLHCTGYSLGASIKCYEQGISYENFYNKLFEKLHEIPKWENISNKLRNLFEQVYSANKKNITEIEIDELGYYMILKQRNNIFEAVKNTLEYFKIQDANDILLHSKALVYDPNNPHLWPITIKNTQYTYIGPPAKNLKEYADFQAYRRSSIFVNVKNV